MADIIIFIAVLLLSIAATVSIIVALHRKKEVRSNLEQLSLSVKALQRWTEKVKQESEKDWLAANLPNSLPEQHRQYQFQRL